MYDLMSGNMWQKRISLCLILIHILILILILILHIKYGKTPFSISNRPCQRAEEDDEEYPA